MVNIFGKSRTALLNVRCALGDVLERDAGELELVLLVLGWFDVNTWSHDNLACDLLADEVTAQLSVLCPCK